MKAQKKKEAPTPSLCRCGLEPCVVKVKGGYVVSCRDPVRCVGNFLTYRRSTVSKEIEEWNNLIIYGGEKR